MLKDAGRALLVVVNQSIIHIGMNVLWGDLFSMTVHHPHPNLS
jgi:hypothetical protein